MDNQTYFSWSCPDQKFSEATYALAVSFKPSWERMTNALLHLTHLMPSHFPDDDLHIRTKNLMAFATERGPMIVGGEIYRGSIEHTMRNRKRPSFEKMAREILDIHEQIEVRRGEYTP